MNMINDEFTHLKISRQRKKQLRYIRDGGCALCGDPLFSSALCKKHLLQARGRQRSVDQCNKHTPGGMGRPPLCPDKPKTIKTKKK
jgi:hypothetical protein